MSQSPKSKASFRRKSNSDNLNLRPQKLEIDEQTDSAELDKLYGALQITDKEFFKRLVEDEDF